MRYGGSSRSAAGCCSPACAPPAVAPATVPDRAPPEFQPHLERLTDLALESLSARKSRELGRVFSQVLEEAQAEGLAFVIYERQQTVYHVTVRSQVAPDDGSPDCP